MRSPAGQRGVGPGVLAVFNSQLPGNRPAGQPQSAASGVSGGSALLHGPSEASRGFTRLTEAPTTYAALAGGDQLPVA